jgi:hypothetical protein
MQWQSFVSMASHALRESRFPALMPSARLLSIMRATPVIVITALNHQNTFPADWASDTAQSVRDAAAEISGRLGWRVVAPVLSEPVRIRA